MPKKSQDTQVVDEITAIVKNFYAQSHTDEAPIVSRENIVLMVGAVCKDCEEAIRLIRTIRQVTGG